MLLVLDDVSLSNNTKAEQYLKKEKKYLYVKDQGRGCTPHMILPSPYATTF